MNTYITIAKVNGKDLCKIKTGKYENLDNITIIENKLSSEVYYEEELAGRVPSIICIIGSENCSIEDATLEYTRNRKMSIHTETLKVSILTIGDILRTYGDYLDKKAILDIEECLGASLIER